MGIPADWSMMGWSMYPPKRELEEKAMREHAEGRRNAEEGQSRHWDRQRPELPRSSISPIRDRIPR